MPTTPASSRALTLSERDVSFPPELVPEGFDPERARERLEQWRRECALGDDATFALRLEQQGFGEDRFLHLLGSPAPDPAEEPTWRRRLETSTLASNEQVAMPTDAARDLPNASFLVLVQPLLDQGWRDLRERLDALGRDGADASALLDLDRFAAAWARPLPVQLIDMSTKTLLLELYLRRLGGDLEGATPEARFESFLASLADPEGARELWATYPVLGRLLAMRVEQWLDAGHELARRLVDDRPRLEAAFGPLGRLADVDAGLGDRHRGGRTVARLEFSSGTKIIYKPRSLALDVKFQELLAWLGDRGVEPRLRTLRVLDRGDYGWVEHIEPATCRDRAELRRFYARQGVYLALLYALEANDFHHENLIAAGEHPVLIDLETLFQPVLADDSVPREDINPVLGTVLRSGLLPRRSPGAAGDEPDLSGLGAGASHSSAARDLVAVGTDEMGFAASDTFHEVPMGVHRPTLDGEPVPLWPWSGVVLDHFAAAYRRLVALREDLVRPGGWLDRFAGLSTRMIVRRTGLYVRIVQLGYHPDYLQDALHRDRLFDKLWLDVERFPYFAPLIPHERHDLWQGDFPLFTSTTDGRHLVSASGVRIEQVFATSGLDLSRHRLESMSEDDLERQSALVRLALATHRPPGEALDSPIRTDPEPRRPEPDELIAGARRVAERLETLAFLSGEGNTVEGISWFQLRQSGEGQSVDPVGYDLYAGLAGIALFFAHLGAVTSEERFDALARRALASARHRLEHHPPERLGLGGYSGLGGWIYTLARLGALWRSADLLDEAEALVPRVAANVPADDGLDLIAGAAGCIAALLALHRHRPSDATLAAAVACGDHLLARAEPMERGLAWRLPQVAEEPLTGFAHGAAGFAWALARLGAATGESRFDDAARGAVAYERSLFSPAHDNWPDLRTDRRTENDWGYFHAWCHGAPGIGLGRLAMLDLWPDPELENEVRAAARSTGAHGFGGSHCLCHGDLGNLELLFLAARRLEDRDLESESHERAGRILQSIDRDGYRCGTNSRVELPGLMTGLAGIGYGLLRLAAPDDVPSVLLLD